MSVLRSLIRGDVAGRRMALSAALVLLVLNVHLMSTS